MVRTQNLPKDLRVSGGKKFWFFGTLGLRTTSMIPKRKTKSTEVPERRPNRFSEGVQECDYDAGYDVNIFCAA